MEFIKKNYEKIVLVVVLLGLTAASCLLPFIISAKRSYLDNLVVTTVPNPRPLPPPEMTFENTALQRASTTITLDYTNKHNLFNPVLWKSYPDGRLMKETSAPTEGVSALQIAAIKPLYLTISYDSTSGNGYLVTIDQQSALSESKRHTQRKVSKENQSELLTLKGVKGPPDKPTELDLVWNEDNKDIVLTPDKPYKEIDGYAADLKYPPESKSWSDRRVDPNARGLFFAGDSYKIVAITESNVVVLAESNKKKTTITFHPGTESR